MKIKNFFATFFITGTLWAYPWSEPQLSIACHWDPYTAIRRANGYDCLQNGWKKGTFKYDTDMTDDEIIGRRHESFTELTRNAVAACGNGCKYFYGSLGGYQCLAIAQNRFYTGLGAFTGTETTKEDSERTALRNCQDFVGDPGRPCKIVLSVCTGKGR